MMPEIALETGRAEVRAILCRAGMLDLATAIELEPLAGGVSSDIFRVELQTGPVCVKRARARLKVQVDWRAPLARNLFEAVWYEIARVIEPGSTPKIFHVDLAAHAIVMEFLQPESHPVWKTMLRDGHVEMQTAAKLGSRLAKVHDATARRDDIRRLFPTDHIFYKLRIEPYLLATAAKHEELASSLKRLARRTAETRLAMVHGDVSPKNILIGPDGPVFLDAECAWFGDPAFDLAFCLNHLLLKCVWRPQHMQAYLDCFETLHSSYRQGVTWEEGSQVELRAAQLIPALLLARIDGKSPVEYIDKEIDRERVRRIAVPLIKEPVDRLEGLRSIWEKELLLDERDQDHRP